MQKKLTSCIPNRSHNDAAPWLLYFNLSSNNNPSCVTHLYCVVYLFKVFDFIFFRLYGFFYLEIILNNIPIWLNLSERSTCLTLHSSLLLLLLLRLFPMIMPLLCFFLRNLGWTATLFSYFRFDLHGSLFFEHIFLVLFFLRLFNFLLLFFFHGVKIGVSPYFET